jgi:hypothetical protein
MRRQVWPSGPLSSIYYYYVGRSDLDQSDK